MGKFVPAIPVSINEFFEKRISFDRHRYTTPFINEKILNDLFGDDLTAVKATFFEGDELKSAFNTQRKVDNYFATQDIFSEKVKQGLFNLISNVILFEEENSDGQQFHFLMNIQKRNCRHCTSITFITGRKSSGRQQPSTNYPDLNAIPICWFAEKILAWCLIVFRK